MTGSSLRSFLLRDVVQERISQFCQAKSLDVLVVMFVFLLNNLDGPPCRQLAVCGPHVEGKRQIAQHLFVSEELKLRAVDECYESCFVYDQENVAATRKVVFPLVNNFIEQYSS